MVGANPPTRFLVTPVGQVVKTSLFHSENTSSTLVRVIWPAMVTDAHMSGR